jgi:ABC-type polysaccharide/polyol phosphate transport system ATPase subunit
MCNRVVLLDGGRLVATGDLEDVIQIYRPSRSRAEP